jgi:hypothetical protein
MTITNVTDKELQQAQRIAELEAEVERLKAAAKYAEHIDATPENQRETMLHDALTERNALRAQIEASQKQEPVAWVTDTEFDRETEIRSNSWRQKYSAKITATGFDTPLYAAPVVAPDVLKDAESWQDCYAFC